jgi:hypothetical protein
MAVLVGVIDMPIMIHLQKEKIEDQEISYAELIRLENIDEIARFLGCKTNQLSINPMMQPDLDDLPGESYMFVYPFYESTRPGDTDSFLLFSSYENLYCSITGDAILLLYNITKSEIKDLKSITGANFALGWIQSKYGSKSLESDAKL